MPSSPRLHLDRRVAGRTRTTRSLPVPPPPKYSLHLLLALVSGVEHSEESASSGTDPLHSSQSSTTGLKEAQGTQREGH